MIGQNISHYKILEKLGEGGMGIVYKAEDTKLKRTVALKFLSQGLEAHEPERARFLQEAQAASALNHPNICTVHDLQESAGQYLIVMEYIDGKTLRQMIPVQKLKDAITYAIQIGEALQEAHGKGVIHRDVKTDNIMVNSRNQVKVMDFGLAKLKGSLKLTRTSSTVGTLAYMAPEQIQGGEVDARSDIFSFGVVVYELLTGHLPFDAVHEAAMMYCILNEAPQPVQKYLPGVSSEVMYILNRALEKDPAERYQSMSDILIDLNRVRRNTTKLSCTNTPIVNRHGFFQKHRFLISLALLLIVLITVMVYLLFLRSPSETPAHTLAVLPFRDLASKSADADEMWRIGMTDAIIGRLTALRNLAVRPTSAVLKYAKGDAEQTQVAQYLKVESILDGTFQRVGSIIRVSVQLVDCRTWISKWSDQYDLQTDDMLKFQDDVARKVVEGLKIQITDVEKKTLETPMTKSSEAYNLFLAARSYRFAGSGSSQAEFLDKVISLTQKALAIDTSFAQAHADLGLCYASSYMYLGVGDSVNRREKLELAQEAAKRAVKLNPRLSDGYEVLGTIFRIELKFTESIQILQKAIAIAPNSYRAWYYLGHQYHYCGLLEQAEKAYRRSIELDPNVDLARIWHAQILLYLGRTAEAEQLLRRKLEADPNNILMTSYLGLVLYYQGKITEAEPLLIRAAELWWPADAPKPLMIDVITNLENLYASQAKRDKIDVRFFAVKPGDVFYAYEAYRITSVYALLGEKDNAFRWLHRAVDLGYHNYPWYERDKNLNNLRSDLEFQHILRAVQRKWEGYKTLFEE